MNISILKNFRFPVFLVVTALAIPLSLYAPKALTPLLVLLWLSTFQLKPRSFSNAFLVLMLLVVWCLLESFRMEHPVAALTLWAKLTLLVMAGVISLQHYRECDDSKKMRIARVLAGGMATALLLCIIDILSGNAALQLFRNVFGTSNKVTELNMLNRGACFIALAVWPAMLAVARLWPGRIYPPMALWGVSAVVVSQMESMSAMMGIIAAALAFAWVKFLPRMYRAGVAISVVLVLLVTPFALLKIDPDRIAASSPSIPLSFLHRLHIWKFASHKALEKPWLGYGFHGAASVPGADAPIVVNGQVIEDLKSLPGHTHNGILQVWLELGVPGVVLYAMLAGVLLFGVLRDNRILPSARAAFTAMLTGYVVIGMTAFGIWQEWWIAAGFLAATFIGALGYAPSSALASAQNPATSSASGLSVGSMPA